MSLNFVRALAIGSALSLGACATAQVNYSAPAGVAAADNEIIVSKPFSQVWDRLVAELSKSFFVINNIEKDSRIINVSFSSSKPTRYVDCGTTTVTSSHPARGEQTWTYAVADDSAVWVGIDGTNHIMDRARDTNLEGRVNIFLAPEGSGSTLVRVNAKYALSVTVRETGVTAPYNNVHSATMSFSTNEPTTDYNTTCTSKGVLESELIEMARRAGL